MYMYVYIYIYTHYCVISYLHVMTTCYGLHLSTPALQTKWAAPVS